MSNIGKEKPGETQENVEKIKITSEEEIEKKMFKSLKKHELPDYLLYTGTYAVLHQLDQKIIYPHYDFKHLTESILKSE